MNYKKNEIKKRKNIINLIKQNGYEIDCKLLNNMYNELNCFYTYINMVIPIYCSNGNVYGKLSIDKDLFIIKFKDYQSINASSHSFSAGNDYNFDYNEENLIVNNHAFTIIYNYTAKYTTFGTYNIYILDKDSRKLLIEIDRESSSINIDIFKLFGKSIYKSLYKRYENGHQWINNYAGLLPSELTSIITKCQVLLSLSF